MRNVWFIISDFWKRAPWYIWAFAIVNVGINFFTYWAFGGLCLMAWIFFVPSAIYLIDQQHK